MNTILVPSDYSESAHQALKFACLLSQNVPIKIIVFHWTEILIPTSTPQHMYKELYEEQINCKVEELRQDSEKVISLYKTQNIIFEYQIGDGADLDNTLIASLKENNVDVIVMGTLGASGIKKILIGSNTAKIIDKSEVPVIAVPFNYNFNSISKIGYASDLSDVVDEVSELVRFARIFGAAIEIFHVYPTFPVTFEVSQENVDKLMLKLNNIYPEQKFSLHVIQTYKDNDIVYGIEKYIDSFKPDVLAMFTLKRSFWEKLFDASNTEEIALSTKVPLLTLKKQFEN